jgi:hypothetical protein
VSHPSTIYIHFCIPDESISCSTLISKGECAEVNACTVVSGGLAVLYNGLQLKRTLRSFRGKKFGLTDAWILNSE